MMLCYSKTRKINYFLDPPPHHHKKRLKCLSTPAARDLDIHLVEIEQRAIRTTK